MPETEKEKEGILPTWKLKPTSCFILLELTSWSVESTVRVSKGDTSWGLRTE